MKWSGSGKNSDFKSFSTTLEPIGAGTFLFFEKKCKLFAKMFDLLVKDESFLKKYEVHKEWTFLLKRAPSLRKKRKA